MFEQAKAIFLEKFNEFGFEFLGYFVLALCLGMFFLRSTQKRRFHLISTGCYFFSVGCLLQVILPALVPLNPSFYISPENYRIIQGVIVSAGCAFLWASLFVNSLGKSSLFSIALLFFIIQAVVIQFLQRYIPRYDLVYLSLSLCWIVVGLAFHFLKSVGKTSFFDRVGDAFFILAAYYVLYEFKIIPGGMWGPFLVFGGTSIAVLMAQIKFMEVTCLGFEEALEKEKQRRTLFWDIAPFPILVSKLLDDSVIYINPMASKVLKVTSDEIFQFRLKDYFTDPSKRDQLILAAQKSQIVDHFNVQMKSPRTAEVIWLDISARVVELDGDLALYMNLQDITLQKATEERLFKEASTDALTGLYNRRQFEAMCSMSIAGCIRKKVPYCMMMLDIDHFKRVNDTYGHDVGDVVLKHVADILNETHRSSDIIARYGGEEFVVFLYNTDEDGARIAAERIRSKVEKAVIMAGEERIPVTISLGITNSQSGDIYGMIKEADIGLYHSKENGRNRVTVFTEDMREEAEANS